MSTVTTVLADTDCAECSCAPNYEENVLANANCDTPAVATLAQYVTGTGPEFPTGALVSAVVKKCGTIRGRQNANQSDSLHHVDALPNLCTEADNSLTIFSTVLSIFGKHRVPSRNHRKVHTRLTRSVIRTRSFYFNSILICS